MAARAALVADQPQRAAAELATVKLLAAEVTAELRGIVAGLLPADLAGDGLDIALRKQVQLLDRVHGAEVVFDGCPVPRLDGDRTEAAYRIAQEALHNALRHGGPTRVMVRLAAADGAVTLTVTDDGTGFDPTNAATAGRRLGIASILPRPAR